MKNSAHGKPTTDKIPAEAHSNDPFMQEMTQVEALTHELNKLLINYETTLQQEGIRHEVETLARWLETYRHGLSAAHKISKNSTYWLFNFRNKLKLAAEELQRLEGEGGAAINGEHLKEAEKLLKAIRRIDEVLPNIQHMFCKEENDKNEHCLT